MSDFTPVGAGYRKHRPQTRSGGRRERMRGKPVAALLVFAMACLHGLTQSLTALVTEGRVYPSPDDPLRLAGACLLEPLLYRPLLALRRCQALVTMGRRARWSAISRKRLS